MEWNVDFDGMLILMDRRKKQNLLWGNSNEALFYDPNFWVWPWQKITWRISTCCRTRRWSRAHSRWWRWKFVVISTVDGFAQRPASTSWATRNATPLRSATMKRLRIAAGYPRALSRSESYRTVQARMESTSRHRKWIAEFIHVRNETDNLMPCFKPKVKSNTSDSLVMHHNAKKSNFSHCYSYLSIINILLENIFNIHMHITHIYNIYTT